MGWFENAFLWPRLLTSSEGRDKLKNDIRNSEGVAGIGSPLHGLSAGYEMTKLGSPYRLKQTIGRLRDGEDPFSRSFIGNIAQDQYENIGGAFKENWPVLAFMGGGLLSGGESAAGGATGGVAAGGEAAAGSGGVLSAGDAAALEAASASAAMSGTSGASAASGMGFGAPSAGTNWLGIANQSAGLLGQAAGNANQQQQPTVMPAPQQPQQQDQLQQRVAMQKRIQQLRMKSRKTLQEQQELQELMRQAQGGIL